jgi:hypothetical protein
MLEKEPSLINQSINVPLGIRLRTGSNKYVFFSDTGMCMGVKSWMLDGRWGEVGPEARGTHQSTRRVVICRESHPVRMRTKKKITGYHFSQQGSRVLASLLLLLLFIIIIIIVVVVVVVVVSC